MMFPSHALPLLLILYTTLVFLFFTTTNAQNCAADLHFVNGSGAKCLDGSPGAYYLQKSTTGSTSWIIAFEGGGECVTRRQCTSRATTPLGSSTTYEPTMVLNQLQSCENENPFRDWNKIFIKYCSGDLFFGTFNAPHEDAFGLQFSGMTIARAVFDHVFATTPFLSVGELVITGYSAGGLAIVTLGDDMIDFIYLNLPATRLPTQTYERLINGKVVLGPKIALIPIAGYHFETNPIYKQIDRNIDPAPAGYIPWKFTDFEKYYTLWRARPPSRCLNAQIPPHECLIAQGSYSTIITPMFVVQSIIDGVVLNLHGACPTVWGNVDRQCYSDSAPCYPGVKSFMQIWQGNMTHHLQPVKDKHIHLIDFNNNRMNTPLYTLASLQKGIKMDGAFAPACMVHTDFSKNGPWVDNLNYYSAISNWWNDDTIQATSQTSNPDINPHFHMDQCTDGDIFCGKCRA